MEGVYDSQGPLVVPQHDDPEASDKLQEVLVQLVERLRVPDPEPSEILGCQEAISHPDTDAVVLAIQMNGRKREVSESPLRVSVFPQDSIYRRRRTYIFRSDGTVSIEVKRDRYRELTLGPDSVVQESVEGWPEAVRHMFAYISMVLLASASWEARLAGELEALAQRVIRSGSIGPDEYAFARGKLAGEAGFESVEKDQAYIRGYKEGRAIYDLSHPARR